MTTMTQTWMARLRAIRKVAAEYGLDGDALASIGAVSRSPAPERALDASRDRQNLRAGVASAFATNATLDREVPSHAPEPGVVHHHVG
jgi:hypothetical protein